MRRKGAKKVTLSLRGDGTVTVTRPWWVRESFARNFLEKHLDWIFDKTKHLANIDQNFLKYDDEHYREHKNSARKLSVEKVEFWNEKLSFQYNKISVRRARSRWGSCSSKGNLNFNYKILFLPVELQDYLIVHELCHLKEMNHSSRFWKLVEEQIPEYKECERRLRSYDF